LAAFSSYSDGSNLLVFLGYGTLQGGTAADIFNVSVATTANLKSGAGADVFTINAPLSGSVSGEAGSDMLNVDGNVTLNGSDGTGFSGTNVNVSAGFSGIDLLTGGVSTDTFTGENLDSTWSLGASPSYSDGSHVLAISGYGTFQGGTAIDSF